MKPASVDATREEPTVLLLGGTGRTGGRVLMQLLDRGVRVRAVVRSAERLPPGTADDARLAVTVAELPYLSDDDLAEQVRGCAAVISCLGHAPNLSGIYGQPRDLVAGTVRRVCRAVAATRPERPTRFILMSAVSVNRPGRQDTRRSTFERLTVRVLRGLIPPAKDNQRAADHLLGEVGTTDPYVQWAAVRPDTLREGDVSAYTLHEGLVDSLFRPGETAMANVAHFMCELATDDDTWAAWRGKLPVIVNARAG